MKIVSYEDMMRTVQEEADKKAEDPKHLKDGMSHREENWNIRSGYGKRERIKTK